jgi:hypothetical protein
MRARGLHIAVLMIVALSVSSACGSSANEGPASGATSTTAGPFADAANEQSPGGAAGNANGGSGGGPVLTDAQRIASLCESADSGPAGDADLPAINGNGDARNYAGAAHGLVESLEQTCNSDATP